jgi:hypothetical protein
MVLGRKKRSGKTLSVYTIGPTGAVKIEGIPFQSEEKMGPFRTEWSGGTLCFSNKFTVNAN